MNYVVKKVEWSSIVSEIQGACRDGTLSRLSEEG